MLFKDKSVYFVASILVFVCCTVATHGQSTASAQDESPAVKKAGDTAEEKKTDRPFQIVISAPSERVRALIVASEAEKGSNIETTSEYKIVVSKSVDEKQYGTGSDAAAKCVSTFIVAETENGTTLVRLDMELVMRTMLGPLHVNLKTSEKRRAEMEKTLNELKARAESQKQANK
ncbi:MAG: hypothetical protein QOG23_4621 [Blastocatellia bacterium]|jgi:hypothetical protein|nr:hypothetical protein [Blastocatellia bacterium]